MTSGGSTRVFGVSKTHNEITLSPKQIKLCRWNSASVPLVATS
jgi:hypothetical protein